MELCETFSFPIVTLVDEPGFMIGSQAEREATIRHGTSAVLTAAMTTVPGRRSWFVARLGSLRPRHGPEAYVLAWPSAESGPLPVEGGVAVAFRREIEAAPDPDAKRRELEEMLAARTVAIPACRGAIGS